ncbi:hypothetical protein [Stetteria hydrogenophila]
MNVNELRTVLALTLSTPVKPGSLHRLMESAEFERRLAEAVLIMDFIPTVYERGVSVARGRIPSGMIGLGSQLSLLYRRVLEQVDVRPLHGLSASVLAMSAAAGYLSALGKPLREGLRQAVTALLYNNPGEDTVTFIEGLEATGASDLIGRLEDGGLTKSTIRLENVPLGDVFEKLEAVDQGFSINIRGYSRVVDLARAASRGKSLAAAILLAYLEAAGRAGYRLQAGSLRKLIEADREIRRKARLDGLLGLTFAATVLVLDENPGLPVT